MHGRFRSEGEGSCRSLRRSISWHMQPTVIPADSNSFFKDGRKIGVGDCALFKPPQDAPPFIGLIRQLTLNKDKNLQLAVNWLYRPAELKLGKGFLLDSAPNEVFYSFHKDEIAAASLLHPCKVAFLPRGAELPTGTSSFVCRRVYDIENKCLWWLTDQDYTNERQEEVEQLLYKTRIEMHGTTQPGGRSPKQTSLTSARQLKHGSENAQNSGTSFPSQTKGKKRERGDHSTDPVKRERSSRVDESGSDLHKTENNVKSDIGKMTEQGGVGDFEGVEKLVQLMQKKLSLLSRSMVARIVAATEKIECLNRFMQLKGLSIFDEWLQEIQKTSACRSNLKDGDKSVEDFLLFLLRALDKLPVDLPALQTCNIGRSVNHLRSHKNVDIQRKARSLVDTWKKRVQAEMIIIDAEMNSDHGGPVWSSKSRLPESSHAGSRTPSGSDVAMKSSITQHSASKTTSVKSSHGENSTKSASSSPGPVKPSSPSISVKESQPGTPVTGSGIPDAPLSRDDRSSSSSQSHSYSPSISTKEEAKSSSSSSRNRKGGRFPGFSGAQKESGPSKSFSTIGNSTPDKVSPSGTASDRVLDGHLLEAGNPKLIVKLPNRSWSSSRLVSRKSLENPSAVNSQTSVPVLSDKLDAVDKSSGEKSENLQCVASSDVKVDSCQVDDRKDILKGSGDGSGSVVKLPNRSWSPSQFRRKPHPNPSAVSSQTSAPVLSDKLDSVDKNSGQKSEILQNNASPDVKVDSCQVNDRKDILTESSDGAGSVVKLPNQSWSSSRLVSRKSLENSSAVSTKTSVRMPSEKLDAVDKSSGEKSETLHCNASSDVKVESCQVNDRKEIPTEFGDVAGSVVKLPNQPWSPPRFRRKSQNPSAVSSQTSVPVLSEKLDVVDKNSGEKSEPLQCNASSDWKVDSCQVNDGKDIMTGSGDGAGSVAVLLNEEKSISTEDSRLSKEGRKKNQLKVGKFHETSFSPMNALIESCVKYSEAHSTMSPEDDVGMNLLASVATGEMSRSELLSPTDSSDDAKSKYFPEDQIQVTKNERLCDDGEGGHNKLALLNGSRAEDGLHVLKQPSFSSDINCRPCYTSTDMAAGETNKPNGSASADSRSNADSKWEVKNLTQKIDANKIRVGDIEKEVKEDAPSSIVCVHSSVHCENEGTNVAGTEDMSGDDPLDTAKGTAMVEVASPNQSYNIDSKSDVNDGLMVKTDSMKKSAAIVEESELMDRSSTEKSRQTSPRPIFSEVGNAVKVREMEEKGIKDCASEVERDKVNRKADKIGPVEGHSFAGQCSTVDYPKSHKTDGDVEKKESRDLILLPETGYPTSVARDAHKSGVIRGPKHVGVKVDEVESAPNVAESSSAAIGPDPDAKVRIDLNEGFTVDDGKYGEPGNLVTSVSTNVHISNSQQYSVNPFPAVHPASITVAAAAKGPFVPPEDLLKSKGELGWKGSAATSAFRPAEPRKVIEVPLASTNFSCGASTSKNGRVMLDIDLNIDLNVPDEKIEEMSSGDSTLVNNGAILLNKSSGCMPVLGSGGLDLDLNRVDESNDNEQCSTSRSPNEEVSVGHAKSLGGLPSADVQRGFDLNDRPGFDDGSAEHLTVIQQVKAAMISQPPPNGPRTNNPALGSLSSWFPSANTYSTMAIPSAIPDRADQSFPGIPPGAAQRMFGPASMSPFAHDVYRGSVLSSSPAMPFPSGPFQFPMYPYGHTFPLSSASFPIGGTSYADSSSGTRLFAPPVNSQLLGPVSAVSSQFQRPFMVGLPDNSSNSGLENGRKWLRQGLDLNTGPGAVDGDVREDNLPHPSSQHFVVNPQGQGEEQARLYSVPGNILKRKEPNGGWDKENLRYKQSPWK